MTKIRVLVVDDSLFMRRFIKDLIETDERFLVVESAKNGLEAIEKVKLYQPDVVTLDVEMPVMDGLAALERLMCEAPVPVIMLSSTTKVGAENTIRAMQLGAIDFVAKPSGAISVDLYKVKSELLEKIDMASRVNVKKMTDKLSIAVPRPTKPIQQSQDAKPRSFAPMPRSARHPIVAIGVSTGGPRALGDLFAHMPKSIGAPICIVQHMPAGFTKSLAERLNSTSAFAVKEAEHGERIMPDVAYIAPGGKHFTVVDNGGALFVHLNELPPESGHRPSVDTLFKSLARLSGQNIISVVLTGMGSDGANGVATLRTSRNNVYTIAQSEASCVVYGMPKAVVTRGFANEVCDIGEVSRRITACCNHKGV
ncbi:MAG: protein-glutamate methylesterase/protein-glutamine glutaminase [Bacilli bacterium]